LLPAVVVRYVLHVVVAAFTLLITVVDLPVVRVDCSRWLVLVRCCSLLLRFRCCCYVGVVYTVYPLVVANVVVPLFVVGPLFAALRCC